MATSWAGSASQISGLGDWVKDEEGKTMNGRRTMDDEAKTMDDGPGTIDDGSQTVKSVL